jgi:hypothetical protein
MGKHDSESLRAHLHYKRFEFADAHGRVSDELVAAPLVGQAGSLASLVSGISLCNRTITLF